MPTAQALHFSSYSENFLGTEDTTGLWAVVICVVDKLSEAIKRRYFSHLGNEKIAMLSNKITQTISYLVLIEVKK